MAKKNKPIAKPKNTQAKALARANVQYADKFKRRESARDIGLHRHTCSLEEKKSYQFDLLLFLKSVFPEKFSRPFSPDQIKFIKHIQNVILSGGQYAVAMPRGEGKSTIISCAVLWAVLYGHKRFLVVTCADKRPADRIIKGIKSTLQCGKVTELFPEVGHYVKALSGLAQRAAGQIADGELTSIGWKQNQINMPFVPMDEDYLELCKGSIITAYGITGGIRGLLETLPDGTPLRPDFLFLDDVQTRESAASPSQSKDRETLIKSDLLPMSGIGTEISALFACTVIEQGDLADKILDEWQSTRAKALYKFPDEHAKLWAEYIDLYRQSQKQGTQEKDCNDFYTARREAMDKGATVGNENRVNKGELSALQNIYNFIAKYGEQSFYSELQNSPSEKISKIVAIKQSIICSRLNRLPRYAVPPEANFLTVYADVNYVGLNYVVLATANNFTSCIVDYGKYPEGRTNLIEENEGETSEASQKISKGILDFISYIYKKPFVKNGKRILPQKILIDGNFMSETVANVVKSLQRNKYPCFVDRGRSNKQYRPAKADKIIGQPGNNLHIQKSNFGDMEIVHNSDYWKMICQKSFLLAHGQAGSCTLWGDNGKQHEDFADEICAEKLVKYDAAQNYYEYHKQPNQRNDKLDALAGAFVAASVQGAQITGGEQAWRPRKKERARRQPTTPMEG